MRRWRTRWLLTVLGAVCLLIGVAISQDYRSGGEFVLTEATSDAAAPVRGSKTVEESVLSERGPLTLQDAIELARQSRGVLRDVRDYTAVFAKRERIKGRLRKQVMDMKLRAEPFSVYLLYQSKKEAGRQAIYVAGRNDDNLLAKESGIMGLAGVLRMGLQNPLVMAESRYPVSHLGIANLIETVLAAWERESQLEGVRPIVEVFPDVRLGEVACQELQVTYENPHPEVEFHVTRLYFDRNTTLPIRAERYGWPQEAGEEPPLMEEYIYSDMTTNVGLTDADFDPSHYGF